MSSSSASGRRRVVVGVVAVALLAAVGYAAWRWLGPKPRPDMAAVLQANNRGVGLMEQFQYPDAVTAFEEVVKLAPDWAPGRINLGIALLNARRPGELEQAVQQFNDVLAGKPDDDHAARARFCLGVIHDHLGNADSAAKEFEAVTRLAPHDGSAWCWLGKSLASNADTDPQRVADCYREALKRDPYLHSALYALAMHLRQHDPAKADAMMQEWKALKDTEIWFSPIDTKYTDMGPYGNVIGRAPAGAPARTGPLPVLLPDDKLRVQLADGARWAGAGDHTGPDGELRARVQARFGGAMAVFDYNDDRKPDLFLLGAAAEAGKVRDLLLRNDGDGRFTDVTAAVGLAGASPGLGCAVGDFDNDGRPDLFVTGAGGGRLYRNAGGKGGEPRFEDVTAEAGLDKIGDVCLGACFVDLDQDGDLDLLVARHATRDGAAAALKGDDTGPGAGAAVYLNVGEAKAATPSENPPPLPPRFRPADGQPVLTNDTAPAVSFAAADLDADRDLDLLVLADRAAAEVVLNRRLLRFRRAALSEGLVPAGKWNGALTLDVNHDERSDLLIVGPGKNSVLLLQQERKGPPDEAASFAAGATNSPPLLQAQAIDLSLDGWADVVGLSEERRPVLLHNDGSRLVHAAEALGRDADLPRDLLAVAAVDLSGNGSPDVLLWSEAKGLLRFANQGNGNHGLAVKLIGHRRADGNNLLRCNADGVGTWVTAQAGDSWTAAEYATLSAGLGQSLQPLVLGLGRHKKADVVRLRWPDNTWQADLDRPTGETLRIDQRNRKPGSCPVLFAWDGRRFVFVTDFLGEGTVGEMQAGGGHRPPRPEESVKIEGRQLALRDGHFVLKVADPMDEINYLDRLQLLVLDHLEGVQVYPDERFATTDLKPTQDLFVFREEIHPLKARDHRGRDELPALARRFDRLTADGFARRRWPGVAEEHWVEFDFGDRLAKYGPGERLVLCLAGWTDYAWPESIWAATQAGIAPVPPVLERLGDDGKWRPVAEVGFPAGLPRVMTFEVTGKLGGPKCVVRLRTNLNVYWDQIFVAPVEERVPYAAAGETARTFGPVSVTPLEVSAATLASRGYVQEFSPDGREPTLYDHDRLEPVVASRWKGDLTRTGDVTDLLRRRDDCFAIFGPGDEVEVRFDARSLPEVKPGWSRSYVLRTWGYCKDAGPFTETGESVGPLPFRGMSNYPYGPGERYPSDPEHEEYRRRYNTRRVGPGR